MADVSTQIMPNQPVPQRKPLSGASNPVTEYLQQQAEITPEKYKENMLSMYGSAPSFGTGSYDPAISGALKQKLSRIYEQDMGLKKGAFERGLSQGYMQYMSPAQKIAEMEEERRRIEDLIKAQAREAAKARRRGLSAAMMGLAGTGIGAAAGGPAGAAIGGGIGQILGGN